MLRWTRDRAELCASVIRAAGIAKRRRHPSVYNVPIAFDTETTSYTSPEGEMQPFVYIWMLRIGDPDDPRSIAVYGRDIAEFGEFLDMMAEGLGLGPRLRIVIYVHNLGFDIEFIRHLITIGEQLHADPHAPIYVSDPRGIEFRDSMILSGNLALKKIGEDLRHHDLSKKCGDLDYRVVRTPDTPLTDKEMGYCQGDVDVLAAYISEEMGSYGTLQDVPLTNTGRVRRLARERIYAGSEGFRTRHRSLMRQCVLSPEEYDFCVKAFMGGFSHANMHNSGKIFRRVKSYDFASSYPSVMATERYPMGRPRIVMQPSLQEAEDTVQDENKRSIWHVVFRGLQRRPRVGDSYLSSSCMRSKCENVEEDNGRIISAEECEVFLTDVDICIASQCYTWQSCEYMEGLVWDRVDYLPTPLVKLVLELYRLKTTLKGVPGKDEEYRVAKERLNSLYGMCVTKILRDVITLTPEGWDERALSEDERKENIEKNNQSWSRFLYYPWGIYITAYARRNLWSAITVLGDDYIYADTDSIKVKASSRKLENYLRRYQEDLDLRIKIMCSRRPWFSPEDLAPCTPSGKRKQLGSWDYEGLYTRFKTLGAKRYLVEHEDGSLDPTVAGIKPEKMAAFLRMIGAVEGGSFQRFEDGLYVPAKLTGKLGSWYIDHVDAIVEDVRGVPYHVIQPHGVWLGPLDFTLTMSDSYLDILKRLEERYNNAI